MNKKASCVILGVALALPLLFCGCNKREVKVESASSGSSATFQRVINGTAVSNVEVPQLVEIGLVYADGSQGLCSGVAVGEKEILTATHCFLDNPTDVIVRSDIASIEVEEVIAAPGFRSEPNVNAFFNDVAIIRTAAHGLPTYPILSSQSVFAGETVLTFGYGVDESGSFGTLKSGASVVELVTPNHIFSAPFNGEGSNPCFGDSGGPALAQRKNLDGSLGYALAGLVSSGTTENCLDGDITLFTSLQQPQILEFLRSYIPAASYL